MSIGLLWSIAAPLTTGPDEADQMIRAAAVVRGEWLGHPVRGHSKADRWVVVPATYRNLGALSGCVWNHPRTAADCPVLVDSSKLLSVGTYVGRYPPLYYLLVGGPTLLTQDTTSVYAMRWMSVLVDSLFLGLAAALAALFGEGTLVVLGLLVAMTPLVFTLASNVEPSGLEIACAICLWTCLALLALQPESQPPRALLNSAGFSAVVLTLSRTSSPEWVIGIVLLAIGVLLRATQIRALWAVRAVRRWSAAVLAVAVLALGWIVGAEAYLFVPEYHGLRPSAGESAILGAVATRFAAYLTNFAQHFTIHDGQDGRLVDVLVGLLLLLIVGAGLLLGTHRQRLLMAIVVVGTLLLPFVVTVLTWRQDGLIWQARYSMPFAVGLPIVAGTAIGGPRLHAAIRRPWVSGVIVGAVVFSLLTQFTALYGALRRFVVGPHGQLDVFFLSHPKWSPPLPVPVIAVAEVVVTLGAIMWFVKVLRASALSSAPP
ncbi:MAG: DUF2142 domain-containing protein [Acidimicrobiales bacterium]